MVCINIKSNANGGRDYMRGHVKCPDGWAVIPASMDTPNFPFGEVEVEEVNGVMTVTKWTPGEMPEPEPVPEPEVEPDVWDELAEAYRQGVQSAYDE